jgi:cytochrome c-type biogenesis protein CcmH
MGVMYALDLLSLPAPARVARREWAGSMTLWFVFALMTAAAIFAVLLPLAKRGQARGGTELAVYRDQLDEIGRDRAAGLIGATEAEAARIEVSRRLLAAADTDKAPVTQSIWRRRATALAALLVLPAGATAFYLALGSPQLPGEPLAARMQEAHKGQSIAQMIAQIEAHLEQNPNDARGWQVVAPVYMRLGRYDQAAIAQRKLIALQGESADRDADLGEALTAAANGVVTQEAKDLFQRAAKLDADQIKAQFFLGMAAHQDGNKKEAAAIWFALLAKAPADADWAGTVREALAQVGGVAVAAAPVPDAAQAADAAKMNDAGRNEMIRGMVARLADKLKENGGDLDGWQRLLRAYVVLGDRAQAHAAALDAKRALAREPGKLHEIEDIIKILGLES